MTSPAHFPAGPTQARIAVREFPRLYAGIYRTFRTDLPFWRRMARAAGGPVLELGSGTGRVAADLARHGFAITGIDSDPDMITWAEHHRPPLPSGTLTYLRGDIADFQLPTRYNLVLCPCNTLSLLRRDQAQRALQLGREHLVPHGVFAAEMAHPRDVRTGPPDPSSPLTAFLDDETGRPVQVFAQQHFDAGKRVALVEWRLDELLPDGRVSRNVVQQALQLWEPAEIQQAFLAAGFAGSSLLGGYQAQGYDEHSDRMLVVAVAP